MVKLLAQSALTLLANAAGLLMASLILPGFHINLLSFIVSVVFFTGMEILLEPFVQKMTSEYMPALRGFIALLTTFAGLLVTVVFTRGLQIDNILTWILAPLVIWLFVFVAAIILPMFLFKTVLSDDKPGESSKQS